MKVHGEQVWVCSVSESREWAGIYTLFTDQWEGGSWRMRMAEGVCVFKLLGCDAEV